jgi:hypothetical protein
VKRGITPEFVNMSKEIFIPQIQGVTNGELDEEIYIKQPEGFVTPGQENMVCRLRKSLCDLKHVAKQWHEKFDTL